MSQIIVIILPILLFMSGCEEKPVQTTVYASEKTEDEIITKKDMETYLHNSHAKQFALRGHHGDHHTLYVSHKTLTFENDFSPLSMVTLSNKDNHAHNAILAKLQDRYNPLLFVLNISDSSDNTLYFKSSNDEIFDTLSNSIGFDSTFDLLTILYSNGKYFTHYEGIVPIEMIQYDLEQAQQNIQ